MTDVVAASEAALAAETRIEDMFNRVLDRLHELNDSLIDMHNKIKAAQPVKSGAVCLELYPCGPGCTGCPHPRWVKYEWLPGKGDKPGPMLGINLDAQKKNPILVLSRKEKHYQALAELIRQTRAILDERAKLLERVRMLRYIAVPTKSD